jgi:hypothetical protein
MQVLYINRGGKEEDKERKEGRGIRVGTFRKKQTKESNETLFFPPRIQYTYTQYIVTFNICYSCLKNISLVHFGDHMNDNAVPHSWPFLQ